MHIRNEEPKDIQPIHQLTTDAFSTKSFSDGTEPAIIDKLRESGNLTLSLVAVKNDAVVGHIAFSPVKVGSVINGWFGLGPISVQPELQRTGIGSALIRSGLETLQNFGAKGCALIGNPDYYSRFGFVSDGSLHYVGVSDENVQWVCFNNNPPSGEVIFCSAFDN